jgi:hypothetical protein
LEKVQAVVVSPKEQPQAPVAVPKLATKRQLLLELQVHHIRSQDEKLILKLNDLCSQAPSKQPRLCLEDADSDLMAKRASQMMHQDAPCHHQQGASDIDKQPIGTLPVAKHQTTTASASTLHPQQGCMQASIPAAQPPLAKRICAEVQF